MPDSSTSRSIRPKASMIGLGPMGSALALASLANDIETTVWNRTQSRSEALAPRGAHVAPDLAAAVAASELVLTCLRDHATTRELFESLPPEALADRVVVVLASSTPGEARETQRWADARGLQVLIGAIMVPTPLIGTPHALILYAGRRDLFDKHRELLEVLAPRSEFVGDDPGVAALLDTAMVEVFFAGMTAFLHGAAMVTAQGLSSANFLPWANEMLAILPETFRDLASDVDAGTYPGTADNLAMELVGLSHVVSTSREVGVDSRLPELMHDLARRAIDEGHSADGWSRVVELLRRPSS